MRFENKINIMGWEEYYKLAKVYFEKMGDLEISSKFKTLDGITYNENGYNLGFWLVTQRKIYKNKKLSQEKIELLEKIGMRFENKINKIGWEEYYKLAKVYFEKNNNLEILQRFKTLDGITYDENGYNLGFWLVTQRKAYKNRKLNKERKELLEKIGMRFESKKNIVDWEENYKLAKAYFEKNNNLEIPRSFKTLDGVNYDENGYNLGTWLVHQRQTYKRGELNKNKIKLLEKIGMFFSLDKFEKEWMNKYGLAEAYFNKNSNLEIPFRFKTLDGIDYNENGYSLGVWINTQRQSYKMGKLNKEQIELLEKIGMRFSLDKFEKEWMNKYGLAEAYFKKNNNLEIPRSFKTLDGITYDENGYKLGVWVSIQRQSYKMGKLSKERIELLDKIGMVWEIRKKTEEKVELCEKYQIPYEEVWYVPYEEIYIKTMYLMDNNIPIIKNGKLNPIYNMSNINMEIRYKVTLEELINRYTKKEKEK